MLKIDELNSKSNIIFTYLDNVFTKVYSAIIYRIYALLHSFNLGI